MSTFNFKKSWVGFALKYALVFGTIFAVIGIVNYTIDSADAFGTLSKNYEELAELSLNGQAVAISGSYNERLYQYTIIEKMEKAPETIVLGSSRGMHLGKDITGFENIYNNCVSGACLEDYYAILGLYFGKKMLPQRIIIEVSPWIFYKYNPELRWKTCTPYSEAYYDFYQQVMGKAERPQQPIRGENALLSIPYFQFNLLAVNKGKKTFETRTAIRPGQTEIMEYPDGSILYSEAEEIDSEERTRKVQDGGRGTFSYQNVNNMQRMDKDKCEMLEKMIDYLLGKDVHVILFLAPFSGTQSKYSFDLNRNPAFRIVEDYLKTVAYEHNCDIIGGYDAKQLGLDDHYFFDSHHMDKHGTEIVWNNGSVMADKAS